MIFSSKPLIIRVFMHSRPELEISTLLLFLLKEMGGLVLMVSVIRTFDVHTSTTHRVAAGKAA